jgi:hypothetical protein
METFQAMAAVAADPAVDLGAVRNPSPIVHATLALLLLLIANVLAIYKPLGPTPYGVRMQSERRGEPRPAAVEARWARYVLPVIIGVFALVVLWHLAGRGLHGLH